MRRLRSFSKGIPQRLYIRQDEFIEMLLLGHRKSEWGIGVLRGNLLILVSSNIIWQFSVNIAQPYLSLYVISLGGSSEAIGLVNALGALAGIFLYPFGGYIADMKGRVQLINTATFAYACSFLVFAYAPTWHILAVASFLRSLVLFYAPILTVVQADSVPPGKRSSAFALALSVPGQWAFFHQSLVVTSWTTWVSNQPCS